MNILDIKRLLYYWRPSFSDLELHLCSSWWATAPNMQHGVFLLHVIYSMHTSSICWKPQNACNFTTLQVTMPQMLLFVSKAAKQLHPTSYRPTHTCYLMYIAVLLFCTQVHRTTKLSMPTTMLHNKQPLYYCTMDAFFRCTKQATTYKLLSRISIYILWCLCKYSIHVHLEEEGHNNWACEELKNVC